MNDIPDLYKIAGHSRFLHGVGDVASVIAGARQRNCIAGQVVSHAGDSATHVYLLVAGRARSYIVTEGGRRLKLKCLVPGDAFGLQAMLPTNATYLLTTEIRQASALLAWDRGQIHRLAMYRPALFVNALALASDYLATYLAAQVALVSHSAHHRLADVLIELSRAVGRQVGNGVELDMTNQSLADMANISPFTASRLLNEWQRRGAVRKMRGKLLVQDPHRLTSD